MSKVLLIEDDELMSEMYPLILKEPEFTTVVIKNGHDGLAKATEWLPEIILLDMMMPHMNGLEVLDALKANPDTAAIPVVMLSNLFDTTFIKQAQDKGAVTYLIKSDCTGPQIRTKINEVLGSAPEVIVAE
jgi:CheY-like chemotaxis protein